jgi:hypothetical protein
MYYLNMFLTLCTCLISYLIIKNNIYVIYILVPIDNNINNNNDNDNDNDNDNINNNNNNNDNDNDNDDNSSDITISTCIDSSDEELESIISSNDGYILIE